jgi:hypothetical protein
VRAFGVDALGIAGVSATGDLVDKRAVCVEIVKLRRAAQQQRVSDSSLQVPV